MPYLGIIRLACCISYAVSDASNCDRFFSTHFQRFSLSIREISISICCSCKRLMNLVGIFNKMILATTEKSTLKEISSFPDLNIKASGFQTKTVYYRWQTFRFGLFFKCSNSFSQFLNKDGDAIIGPCQTCLNTVH